MLWALYTNLILSMVVLGSTLPYVQDMQVCDPPKPQPTLTGGLPRDPAICQHSKDVLGMLGLTPAQPAAGPIAPPETEVSTECRKKGRFKRRREDREEEQVIQGVQAAAKRRQDGRVNESEEESNAIEISDEEQTGDLLKLLDELKVEVNRDCELESDAEDDEYRKQITLQEDFIKKNKVFVEGYIRLQKKEIARLITGLEEEEDLKSKRMEELSELDVKRAELYRKCEEKDESLENMKKKIQTLQASVPKNINKIREKFKNLRNSLNNVKIKQAEYNQRKKPKKVIIEKGGPNIPLVEYIGKKIEAKEEELGCPVCFELASAPIYMCPEEHMVCSTCRPQLSQCPQCRKKYKKEFRRHRHAEKTAEELKVLHRERAEVLGDNVVG